MKRILTFLLAALCTAGVAAAQQQGAPNSNLHYNALNPDPDQSRRIEQVPLIYVGGNTRVSLGVDQDGRIQGDALGVFGYTKTSALLLQGWLGDGTAGGLMAGYHWLWGGRSAGPDATVAKVYGAYDQNRFSDRKATFGAGIERKEFGLDVYYSHALSDERRVSSDLKSSAEIITGQEGGRTFQQQIATDTLTEVFEHPYEQGVGFRLSHFFERPMVRLHAGMDYERGNALLQNDEATQLSAAFGVEKHFGGTGHSLALEFQRSRKHGPFDNVASGGNSGDNRVSLSWRYAFGDVYRPVSTAALSMPMAARPQAPDDGQATSTAPAAALEEERPSDAPAWIERALRTPPFHNRNVDTYRAQRVTRTRTEGARVFVNSPPIANADLASAVTNGGSITIFVLSNDTDLDGDQLGVSAVGAAQNGQSAVAAGGNAVTYVPNLGFSGTDTFTYVVADGRGGTSTGSITVTVSAIADPPPVAVADTAIVPSDGTPATIDVLANDTGLGLTVVAVTSAAKGTVAIAGNGSAVTYTATAQNVADTDTFSYTLRDGNGAESTATVSVTIIDGSNGAPTAVADTLDVLTSNSNSEVAAILANDTDPENDTLQLVGFTQGTQGTVSEEVVLGQVVLRYTPNVSNSTGTDQFTYTISDGHGNSAVGAVTVNLIGNRAPIAVADLLDVLTANGNSEVVAVLQNDSDPDLEPIQLVSFTQGTLGAVSQEVVLGQVVLRYTPNISNSSGTDQFTYTIGDASGNTAIGQVTVNLIANNAPVAIDDGFIVTSNGVAQVLAGLLANDTDIDSGDVLSISSFTQGTNGTVAQTAAAELTYTANVIGFSGSDQFQYTITDSKGGSATATVSVTVNGAPAGNLPPSIINESFNVPFETALSGQNVLVNDTDPEGAALTASLLTQGAKGVATVASDGSFTYQPNPLAVGADTVTYAVSDGQQAAVGTVNINIAAPTANIPPQAFDDVVNLPSDGLPHTVAVLVNDTDPNGDPLRIIDNSPGTIGSAVFLSADPTAIVYTVDQAHVGTTVGDIVTYTVSDSRGGTAVATLLILHSIPNPQVPPVAREDFLTFVANGVAVTIDVLSNDSDTNPGDVLTILTATTPARGQTSLSADRKLVSYLPNPNQFGPDSFSYTVSDGHGGTATALVSLDVQRGFNTAPTAGADTFSATGIANLDVFTNDSDIDGDAISIASITAPDHNGKVLDQGNGIIRYEPATGFEGVETFQYTISDGFGGTATAAVTVNVSTPPPVNNPPIAFDDVFSTRASDGPRVVNVLANDSDPDASDILELVSVIAVGPNAGTQGTITSDPSGGVTYTVATGFRGEAQFDYTISDGRGGQDQGLLRFIVQNSQPIAVDDAASLSLASTNTVVLRPLDNDSDIDGDTLTIVSLSGPANGTAVLQQDGTITYNAGSGFIPPFTDFINYVVSDAHGGDATGRIDISVNP